MAKYSILYTQIPGGLMKAEQPKMINLKDYKPSNYTISDVYLTFELDDTKTKVTATSRVIQNQGGENKLILNGEHLTLESVAIDGRILSKEEFSLDGDFLTIPNTPASFTLEIVNFNNPIENKALDGLYKSGSMYCTQNEPEGFRRITYFLDRPDVLAKYTTKIIADKKSYPVLLSNGNLVSSGDLADGKHFCEWEDPFPKPSYLYALVAGDLGMIQDSFTTKSNRKIDLRIYCDKGNEEKCHHAMESLKKSMKWDEERFGLEYDLDIYMIVAVDSFNMGAMENKGLNIFNSAYVLAKPETATDDNFLGIESVVGHEYFHNWTGNRVTCRDWFQLTLKEGLTVFRDQEFSGDLNSKAVQRISDVARLRQAQFPEDAGPTSHPIKPQSYIEINNFYTATIYEKGAEVIRMIHTFLGEEGFQKGMKLYFERHDGYAVTTEDFVAAMSDANKFDFSQFKRWYSQAGTPVVNVDQNFDESKGELTLTLRQSCPPTPGQDVKDPYHFPMAIGFLDAEGKEVPLNLSESKHEQKLISRGILEVKEANEVFVFSNLKAKPILSLNRNFSAPVNLERNTSITDLAHLLAFDSDEFNRYEAAQNLATKMIDELVGNKNFEVSSQYLDAVATLVRDNSIDSAFKALALSLPADEILFQRYKPLNPVLVVEARDSLKATIANHLEKDFLAMFHELTPKSKDYKLDPVSVGNRSLRNLSLGFLALTKNHDELVLSHFKTASNMTDEICGLRLIVNHIPNHAQSSLKDFYQKWRKETLVMQKWLGVQALSGAEGALELVKSLESSDVYDVNVPNLVRSLLLTFTRNFKHFHAANGEAYRFIGERVLKLDSINPQVAARLMSSFGSFKKLTPELQKQMRPVLESIAAKDGLSKNTFEVVTKTLNS